jgi:hypothetical protein
MALTQVVPTAGNTAEKIPYAFDGPHFRLGVQVLFQSLAYHFRTLAF